MISPFFTWLIFPLLGLFSEKNWAQITRIWRVRSRISVQLLCNPTRLILKLLKIHKIHNSAGDPLENCSLDHA